MTSMSIARAALAGVEAATGTVARDRASRGVVQNRLAFSRAYAEHASKALSTGCLDPLYRARTGANSARPGAASDGEAVHPCWCRATSRWSPFWSLPLHILCAVWRLPATRRFPRPGASGRGPPTSLLHACECAASGISGFTNPARRGRSAKTDGLVAALAQKQLDEESDARDILPSLCRRV